MLHRLHRPQVRKHRLQIVVSEILEIAEGHDRVQFSRLHVASAHHFDEKRFVVVADARGIGRDVGGADFA
jgi:hypothetical protein